MLNSGISDVKYLAIAELAEAVTSLIGKHCTAAMIYNYERQELIPFPERSPGGFRLYRPEDVNRVVLIKQWQDEGFVHVLLCLQRDRLVTLGGGKLLPQGSRSAAEDATWDLEELICQP